MTLNEEMISRSLGPDEEWRLYGRSPSGGNLWQLFKRGKPVDSRGSCLTLASSKERPPVVCEMVSG